MFLLFSAGLFSPNTNSLMGGDSGGGGGGVGVGVGGGVGVGVGGGVGNISDEDTTAGGVSGGCGG